MNRHCIFFCEIGDEEAPAINQCEARTNRSHTCILFSAGACMRFPPMRRKYLYCKIKRTLLIQINAGNCPRIYRVFSQFVTYHCGGHRGDGAMTIPDYIAIGVLIVLGVFAIAAASAAKFKCELRRSLNHEPIACS